MVTQSYYIILSFANFLAIMGGIEARVFSFAAAKLWDFFGKTSIHFIHLAAVAVPVKIAYLCTAFY